jgi:RNA recognition motif-containing protein
MPNDAEAAEAIAALDGKEMGGRNLKVNEARPKGERPPRSNSGGGRPGGGRNRSGFSHEDTGGPPASRANRAGDLDTLAYLRRSMSITFQKRQKKLKRQEKQRAKAENALFGEVPFG